MAASTGRRKKDRLFYLAEQADTETKRKIIKQIYPGEKKERQKFLFNYHVGK